MITNILCRGFITGFGVLIISSCFSFLSAGKNIAVMQSTALSDNALSDNAITDSDMTIDEALKGKEIPQWIKKSLSLIDVEYYSSDNKLHKGQVLVNKELAGDIKAIFNDIKENKFPVAKVIPIARYRWSDSVSMQANNTSCFNYRLVEGTKVLSAHAIGKGIDINPFWNPQIKKGKHFPENAEYNIKTPGTITESSVVVRAFKKRGWKWGGNWRSTKDYQHFEKK